MKGALNLRLVPGPESHFFSPPRIGGLVKRWIGLLAKKRGKHWYDVVGAVQNTWNEVYVSWLGIGPPNSITDKTFDVVVEALYERDPLYLQSLYPIGRVLTEREARSIFKFAPDERVLVSLRTLSRIIRNPVSFRFERASFRGATLASSETFVSRKRNLEASRKRRSRRSPASRSEETQPRSRAEAARAIAARSERNLLGTRDRAAFRMPTGAQPLTSFLHFAPDFVQVLRQGQASVVESRQDNSKETRLQPREERTGEDVPGQTEARKGGDRLRGRDEARLLENLTRREGQL